MKTSSGLSRINPLTYNLSMAGFIIGIIALISLFVLATNAIDYTWRWYKLPGYFYSNKSHDVTAEIKGKVESITTKDKTILIVVKGNSESEVYTLPESGGMLVSIGDNIYQGDTLAQYRKPQLGLLTQGILITLEVSIYSCIFGILIGLIGGIARISTNPALKWAAIFYVELIRGSPLLVQIFIWYFVFATIINGMLMNAGFHEISALWYGVAALSFFAGAYVTEIVRSGIESINIGQIEASRSLGMTSAQCMYHIVLPQAIRRILPPLAGQFITLIKDSSLLGIIAVRELTKATREGITTSLQPYEFWFVCAILYLLLTFPLSMFVQYIERRMKTP
ncbi:MAG: ABC transporter permease subunit [Desulfobacterales bacterium]|nr:ABC transporter permease subunit [Desulfobacterales bacterium]